MWDVSASKWVHENPHTIVPNSLDCKGLHAWIDDAGRITVMADSNRHVRNTGEPIYEVVWCGRSNRETTTLFCAEEKDRRPIRNMLEVLASSILASDPTCRGGLLFVSSALHQGGANSDWSHPWSVGTSGCHATYIYNYMPPAFWNCRAIFARSEL